MENTLKAAITIGKRKSSKHTNFGKTGQLSYLYGGSSVGGKKVIRHVEFQCLIPLFSLEISHHHRCLAAVYPLFPIQNTCTLSRAKHAYVWKIMIDNCGTWVGHFFQGYPYGDNVGNHCLRECVYLHLHICAVIFKNTAVLVWNMLFCLENFIISLV